MGGVFSYLLSWVAPGPVYDATPDPITGLSERDCHAILDTWALVSDRKSIKQNGVEFFIALFKAHPYLLAFFPAFKGLSDEEMRRSPGLRAHATSVMYGIKSYVGTVDDAETLAGLVTKTATSHVPRGVTVKDVENLAVVFLDFMKDALGSQWTPEAASAWKQLFAVHCVLYKKVQSELKPPELINGK
ncbi:globin [Elysia marginata]|uniref:Globin n=1 Tax=Elysia marginata TaxID=1093978 RepID=A0AAV4FUK6_9GAST|nr:globin [Elysia marginata]